MLARLRHRWRYRTLQVTRLRAAVYAARCPACHRDDWDFLGYEMLGDVRFSRLRCGACGWETLCLS